MSEKIAHQERMVEIADFVRKAFPNHVDFVVVVHDYQHGLPPCAVDNYSTNEAVKLLLTDVLKTYDQSAVESFRVADDGTISTIEPRPLNVPNGSPEPLAEPPPPKEN